MDVYDEESKAHFLTGVDTTIVILQAALRNLCQAKAASEADRPAEAFEHYDAVMVGLETLVQRAKCR